MGLPASDEAAKPAFCCEHCGMPVSRDTWGICCRTVRGESKRALQLGAVLNDQLEPTDDLGPDVAVVLRARSAHARLGADPRLAHLFRRANTAAARIVGGGRFFAVPELVRTVVRWAAATLPGAARAAAAQVPPGPPEVPARGHPAGPPGRDAARRPDAPRSHLPAAALPVLVHGVRACGAARRTGAAVAA